MKISSLKVQVMINEKRKEKSVYYVVRIAFRGYLIWLRTAMYSDADMNEIDDDNGCFESAEVSARC